MSKGQHRNPRVNIPRLRGKLLPPSDAGVKRMIKITLEIKGRNSVWASRVRRKSQCVRREIKVKTSKLPRKPQTSTFPMHPYGVFPEATQRVFYGYSLENSCYFELLYYFPKSGENKAIGYI